MKTLNFRWLYSLINERFSKKAVYKYFPDKEAIGRALYETYN